MYFSEQYGFYALSRYDDVVRRPQGLADVLLSHGVDLSALTTDPAFIASLRSIIMMDPPEHDRFRALVSRVFTPQGDRRPRADGPRGHRRLPRRPRRRTDVRRRGATSRVRSRSRSSAIMLGVPAGRAPADPPLARRRSCTREPGQLEPSPRASGAMLESASTSTSWRQEAGRPDRRPAEPAHRRPGRAGRRRRDVARRRGDRRLRRAAGAGPARRPSRSSWPTRSCCSTATRTSGSCSWTTRRRSRPRWRRSCASCRPRSTRAGSACRTSSCTARRSRPATPCCC